jgi:hypothetical protein
MDDEDLVFIYSSPESPSTMLQVCRGWYIVPCILRLDCGFNLLGRMMVKGCMDYSSHDMADHEYPIYPRTSALSWWYHSQLN